MPNYNNFSNVVSLQGKLKPTTCKACSDDGHWSYGVCEKCLKNQAYNREYLETHMFVYDTSFRQYHDCSHDDFKSLVLRLPNEHPYLYYGIELEVEFDRDLWENYYDEYDDCDNQDMTSDGQEILKTCNEIFPAIVYEYDGSLAEGCAVEFIFRPMSYGFLTDKTTIEKFKQLSEYLKSVGALIRQPDGNGMHVHLSSKFFERGNGAVGGGQAFRDFDWQ